MEKKNIDWSNIGFGYMKTDKRYVSNFKNGAWDEGTLTSDDQITISECAGVLQYAQTCFEGMKAYTTEDGHIVTFRPDLNAARMANSAARLEMPVFPEDRFVDAIKQVVKANAAYVPPYGSGATLYVRPYMFGSSAVIGVKPAEEYQFRVFATPVGPYFKGGAKPITIKVSDFDRAAPHGTGHVKAGLNILLTDFHRLLCDDALLPAGRLREPSSGKNRAQMVIVTKCPDDIKPIDFNIITKRLNLYPYQQLYFSRFRYGSLMPLFPEKAKGRKVLSSLTGDEQVLLVTGIASPAPLQKEVESYTPHVKLLAFDDHHDFTPKDLLQIKEQFQHLEEWKRLIITTEKDAARLKLHPALDETLKPYIYVLPIEIEILQNQQYIFNQNIIGYVRAHSRNSSLSEGKDAHPA